MCNCAQEVSQIVSDGTNISILELMFNVVMFGIINSFTHCIGMCGSIAIGQSALRMLESPGNPSFLKKIISCVSWEYYIGKALTYSILAITAMKIDSIFNGNSVFAVVKFILILGVIVYLVFSGIQIIYKFYIRDASRIILFQKFLPNFNIRIDIFNNKVLSRLAIGMCLGFIPCGAVYTAIGMIAVGTENTMMAALIAFLFGLMTFPGLFILSYVGNIFFYRYQKVLNFIYLLTVIWNIKFLMMML